MYKTVGHNMTCNLIILSAFRKVIVFIYIVIKIVLLCIYAYSMVFSE